MNSDIRIIVPGGLNTDLIGLGVDRLLGKGELTLGGEFVAGPGGKARNMAQMAAVWLGAGKVAMIGKTVRDPYGLWEIPLRSLEEAGVDITGVRIMGFEESGHRFPGIALIPVDKNGNNQIYCLPGINADFNRGDMDRMDHLFYPSDIKRYLMLALEIPMDTVAYAIERAGLCGMRVILDPGGIGPDGFSGLMTSGLKDMGVNGRGSGGGLGGIFLIKPNEYEAEILTGIKIDGYQSAGKAAERMLREGIQYVMITHGACGAYLFGPDIRIHIPVPEISGGEVCDETGCGDQVTATLTACLAEGLDILAAARAAVKAGTLQFYRKGIVPVTRSD